MKGTVFPYYQRKVYFWLDYTLAKSLLTTLDSWLDQRKVMYSQVITLLIHISCGQIIYISLYFVLSNL